MQGIYRIRNRTNGKQYIGSAQDLAQGWIGRRAALRRGTYHNIHLQRAWNKHGEESFIFEVVEEVKEDGDALLLCEQKYLDRGFASNTLYNIALDAVAPMRGRKNPHTEEWNRKIGEANKGNVLGPLSDEHRRKVSEALIGHEVTRETRDKISVAKKLWYQNNENPNLGRKNTEETIQRMSKAARERDNSVYRSPEAKRKQSEATLARASEHGEFMREWHRQNHLSEKPKGNIGRVWPDETNQKRSGSMKAWLQDNDPTMLGKHHTEEAKNKIGEANGRPYPAFYNILTGDYIPSGTNLAKLCRETQLSLNAMRNIKKGACQQSSDGWILANG